MILARRQLRARGLQDVWVNNRVANKGLIVDHGQGVRRRQRKYHPAVLWVEPIPEIRAPSPVLIAQRHRTYRQASKMRIVRETARHLPFPARTKSGTGIGTTPRSARSSSDCTRRSPRIKNGRSDGAPGQYFIEALRICPAVILLHKYRYLHPSVSVIPELAVVRIIPLLADHKTLAVHSVRPGRRALVARGQRDAGKQSSANFSWSSISPRLNPIATTRRSLGSSARS